MKKTLIVFLSFISIFCFATAGKALNLTSDVLITNIDSTSATISWSSNNSDISYILYGTQNNANDINHVIKNNITSVEHDLDVSGLKPNTTYYFKILSDTKTSNLKESAVFSFKTSEADAPIIRDIKILNITENSVKISWVSLNEDVSYILYGNINSQNGINSVVKNDTKSINHELILKDLKPNTTYYFKILSDTKTSNLIENETLNFKTNDVFKPEISNIKVRVLKKSATITWVSNYKDVSSILFGTINSKNGINKVAKNEIITKNHTLIVNNLKPNTTYYFVVLSDTKTSNLKGSKVFRLKTSK